MEALQERLRLRYFGAAVDAAGPGLPDRSDRWCPGQTSCGIWRRQAGISKAGGGTRRRSGVVEDLWSCLPYLHFKMTSYLLSLVLIYPGLGGGQQLGPGHPLDDGPMPLFLMDPGLGPLSRLLDSGLRWDLVDPSYSRLFPQLKL